VGHRDAAALGDVRDRRRERRRVPPHFPDHRKQQADEDGNERKDNEELDERKGAATRAGPAARRVQCGSGAHPILLRVINSCGKRIQRTVAVREDKNDPA
jgi:hypothetical protein